MRKYRKDARTIRVKATDGKSGRERVDEGNYFRCWNCGFICDIRRDDLSPDGRHGTKLLVYEDSMSTTYAAGSDINLSDGAGHDIVMMPTNSTVYIQRTVSGTGCPLCHTRNWKKQ